MRNLLILAALAMAGPAFAQPSRQDTSQDCVAGGLVSAPVFSMEPGADGRFSYRVQLHNPSAAVALRVVVSFTANEVSGPALNAESMLAPGAGAQILLGTGAQRLSQDTMRRATSLRCTRL